ncbi:cell wall endopeptidase [Renibacterium salmoninarum ATCC 33209]|uniref:Cell wall endopeptidase n=1 Tax=Renibacterium salmoninarum (strain ATCC 33209 / DSM 20767 / JCM 11484 / NBRC 15589 / NCIMB 2235) TaxID=288705 RepID=A9WUF0_RENSM|nr:C40 family peptidase [Renibacterium salmoninarum]ABY24821.1 cell wall endopeptidase [Renibacterium salmoninarum ATCC 33209]
MRMTAPAKHVASCALALTTGVALILGASSLPAIASPNASQPSLLPQTIRPTTPDIPSADDIAQAKQNESATSSEVGKIESIISSAAQNLQSATATTMRANDSYSNALVTLDDYQNKAAATQAKADQAAAASEKARSQVGQLAGEIYKNGGINTSLPNLLTSTKSADVLYQAATLMAITENRNRKLDNAQTTAATASSLKDAAEQSRKAADDAAKAAADAKNAAASAYNAQNAILTQNQEQRTVLVGQLATLRNTTSTLEDQRISGLEAQQRQAQLDAIAAASKNKPVPQGPSGGNGGNTGPGGNPPPPVVVPPPVVPPVNPPPVVPPVNPPPVTPPPLTPPVTPPPSGVNTSGMVNFMMSKVGGSYVWGGTGPGYDCSGLIWAALRSVGVNIARTGTAQFWNAPTRVPISQMQYGDILAFNDDGAGNFSHVGVYIGNGQIVNALNPQQGIMVNRLVDLRGLVLYGYAARY